MAINDRTIMFRHKKALLKRLKQICRCYELRWHPETLKNRKIFCFGDLHMDKPKVWGGKSIAIWNRLGEEKCK